MTSHDSRHEAQSIDELLAERFRIEAPAEAPSWLLSSVRDRIEHTPQHASRMPATVGRLLAAAAVIVLAIGAALVLPDLLGRGVGVGPEASPTSTVVASPSASGMAAPSVSAAPSTATSAPSTAPSTATSAAPSAPSGDSEVVLLEATSVCDVTPPVVTPALSVAADGVVVWRTTSVDGVAEYRARQLSADGLADLRERLDATGLFEATGQYPAEVRPGVEPPGIGACLNTFLYRAEPDGEPVRIDFGAWYGDELESQYFVESSERRALNDLLTAAADPEAWLGPRAWAGEAEPFAPDRYFVLVRPTLPELATEGAPDVAAVTWPFDASPDTFGEVVPGGEDARCGIADADRVVVLARELAAAGLEQFGGQLVGAGATLPWASEGVALEVGLWPVVSDDAPACGQLR